MDTSMYHIPEEETLDGPALAALQRSKLAALMRQVRATNPFYQRKLAHIDFNPSSDPLTRLPFTTRRELEQDQLDHPPYGTNLTYPLGRYCRFHQTSGSGGRPMRWLDTAQSWDWFKRCWGIIFHAAGLGRHERLIFPFSFGPFVGFWAAFESAVALGHLALPAGGMTTAARLRMILENDVTFVCCTPTYALRMAEVAAAEKIDIASSSVRGLIVAGEPGGSIPATRQRIEQAWNARVFDHTGMTEIGPLGCECLQNSGGVHLIESECIPEVIDPDTLQPLPESQPGELVITNLGRWGSPVIRYRTGDHVRITRGRCPCGRSFARMEGGILGRIDDMIIIRGNNVFPAAIEAIVRRFTEVAEFRVNAYDTPALTQIALEIEPQPELEDSADLARRVARAVQDTLSFRADVRIVAPGSLPRFEMKARRFVRSRSQPAEQQSTT